MGGPGSGTWMRWNTGLTMDEAARLDVRELARRGALVPGSEFTLRWTVSVFGEERERGSIAATALADGVELRFRGLAANGSWDDVRQEIPLERTPCNLGGTRVWWTCPGCQRRAAVLFGARATFQCRRCHNLAFPVENEGAVLRAFRRARKNRKRLGADSELFLPFPGKPPNMHWTTYWRHFCAGQVTEAKAWTMLYEKVLA